MRMIQPINALTPRAGFRGTTEAYGKTNDGAVAKSTPSESRVALVNAAGVACSAGALTTLVARAYTKSFAHAGVLGVFGAFLTMFFMTPHLIEKIGLSKVSSKVQTEATSNPELQKITTAAKENAPKARRLFR